MSNASIFDPNKFEAVLGARGKSMDYVYNIRDLVLQRKLDDEVDGWVKTIDTCRFIPSLKTVDEFVCFVDKLPGSLVVLSPSFLWQSPSSGHNGITTAFQQPYTCMVLGIYVRPLGALRATNNPKNGAFMKSEFELSVLPWFKLINSIGEVGWTNYKGFNPLNWLSTN